MDKYRVRILIAPDKFKGSLTAAAAAEAIRIGVRRGWPDAETTLCPIADGGDGFLAAVICANAPHYREHTMVVQDAVGNDRQARFVTVGNVAYVETAEAIGITHQTPTPAVALAGDSYGVGQLILGALDSGAHRLVVGLGGSATTDGGLGMLRALGAKAVDTDSRPIAVGGGALCSLERVELSGLDPRISADGGCSVELVAAFDVANPLLGPTGAAEVYAPQKGADEPGVKQLAWGLRRLRDVLLAETGVDIDISGGGAAGGLGAALGGVLGAKMASGAQLVLEMTGIAEKLVDQDLVVTGEGSFDSQSLQGKGPHAVITAAARAGIPVVVVAGRCTLGSETISDAGVVMVSTLVERFDDPFSSTFEKLVDLTATVTQTYHL